MKFKVGDKLIPKHGIGVVVSIADDKVEFRIPDRTQETGFRLIEATKAQADLRGITLSDLVDKSFVKIEEIE